MSSSAGEQRPVSPSALVWLLALLGALFSFNGLLTGGGPESSSLWFLDPVLYALFLVGLGLRSAGRLPRLRLSGAAGALGFIILSWATGMAYELSLQTGPEGFGGMHPDTATSFLLAQGYYVPFAAGGLWLVRRLRTDFNWLFYTGGLASLYEMLTIGGVAIAGGGVPWLLVPVLLGYYAATYGLILAMPLLLLDERPLWGMDARSPRPFARIVIGILFGLALWLVYLLWAALVQ